jgi:hypothetical protein
MSDADLEKPVGISHNSLLGTLAHILWADWLWFTRVVGPMEKPDQTREVLETVWPGLQGKWVAWAENAGDGEINRVVEYVSILDGQKRVHRPGKSSYTSLITRPCIAVRQWEC